MCFINQIVSVDLAPARERRDPHKPRSLRIVEPCGTDRNRESTIEFSYHIEVRTLHC